MAILESSILPDKARFHHHCGPFKSKITQWDILRSAQKFPKLEYYDEIVDPDEHIEHVDIVLYYYQAIIEGGDNDLV